MKSKKQLTNYLTVLFFILIATNSHAQRIAGRVLSSESPIVYATVELQDSSGTTKDYALTDDQGGFEIKSAIQPGERISVSVVGYSTFEMNYDASTDWKDLKINLIPADENTIDEVVVRGNPPLIEPGIGKLTYNVQSTPQIQTSSTVDVLARAPGMQVDIMNKSISMNGKSNILVLMDNKRIYMTGAELYDFLNNLSASTVQKIELINSPSAKYEASAVINIILKKNQNHGWNGTFSTVGGHGREPDVNSRLTMNYRNEKIAFSGSVGGNFDRQPVDGWETYVFDEYSLDQSFESLTENLGGNVRVALDYFIDSTSTLGALYQRTQSRADKNVMSLTDRLNSDQSMIHLIDDNNLISDNGRDLFTLNYSKNFSEKRTLMLNADYSIKNNTGDNRFLTARNQQLFRNRLNDVELSDKLFAATVDYQDVLFKKYALELGARVTDIRTENSNIFDTENGEGSNIPEYQSDSFNYSENVYAGYANISTELSDHVGLQLGLRGEYTTLTGESISMNETNNRDYFTLLPNVTFNYVVNQNHNLSLSYNKSINRPSFRNLNPFRYYSDIYSASEGNPLLNPSFSHELTLQYLLNRKYVFVVIYEDERNVNEISLQQDIDSEVMISRFENYGASKVIGLQAQVPFAFTKWWTNTFQGIIAHTSTEKTDYRNSGGAYSANLISTIKLPKGYYFEATGNYMYAPAQRIFRVDPNYYANFSVSKSFLNSNLSTKFHVLDAFSSYAFRARTSQQGLVLDAFNQGRGRMLMLSLTYKFGSNKIRGSRTKSNSLGDDYSR